MRHQAPGKLRQALRRLRRHQESPTLVIGTASYYPTRRGAYSPTYVNSADQEHQEQSNQGRHYR